MNIWLRGLIAVVLSISSAAQAAENGLIVLDDNDQGKTIRQLKPAYVDFGYRKAPKVPMNEIVARYRKLILYAPDLEVRIKALHRLLNLEALFADRLPEGVMDKALWEASARAHDDWLNAHPGDSHRDQYRYQLARALEMLGKPGEARKQLQKLVADNPRSPLATESWFRIAERRYAEGHYAEAEKAYTRVLGANDEAFTLKARYMLAWSLFKQRRTEKALDTFIQVLTDKTGDTSENSLKTLRKDVHRIAAIIASEAEGARTLLAAVQRSGHPELAAPLLRTLMEDYLKKEAYQLSASVAEAFIQAYPYAPEAPAFQARRVEVLLKGRLPSLAWKERDRYVRQFGLDSAYWSQAAEPSRAAIARTLFDYLDKLARRAYAKAIKTGAQVDWQASANYLDQLVRVYPADPRTAKGHYLLAESLAALEDWQRAIKHYDIAGYQFQAFGQRAEAAYGGIVAREHLARQKGSRRPQRLELADALLRFARTYPNDKRSEGVQLNAAQILYELNVYERAYQVAAQLAQISKQRTRRFESWKLAALSADALHRPEDAEQAYRLALALITPKHEQWRGLRDALAAAIYAQGERAREQGLKDQALALFKMVLQDVPESPVRQRAQYDAAMLAIELQRWPQAISLMQGYRKDFPRDRLTATLSENLVYAYAQNNQFDRAAGELLQLAKKDKDPERVRRARLQAADYWLKAAQPRQAVTVLRDYVRYHPEPFERNIQVRAQIIRLDEELGRIKLAEKARRALIEAEARGGAARTNVTRTLAAEASWVIAQTAVDRFAQLRLTVPLKASLKRKTAAMKVAVSALKRTLEYGLVEYTTAATHTLGRVYRVMARDIMASERPKGLSELELEQYNTLLEDQAFPFEEKAIALFETNARRTVNGIYDVWVQKSFAALAELVPGRYNKQEQSVEVVHALY